MNVVLWILQVLLALAFLAHGLLVLMPPPDIAALIAYQLTREGFSVVVYMRGGPRPIRARRA